MKNLFKITGLLLLILVLFSCKEVVKDLGKASIIYDTLTKTYNTKNIKVNIINGNYLTVSLINTSYNDSLDKTKQKIACDIGKIVFQVMQADSCIKGGNVEFVVKKNYFIYHTSNSLSFDMHIDRLYKNE